MEHRHGDNEFLFRIGAAYEFMLNERWMLTPEIAVDFVDGEEAFVYGLVLGYGFYKKPIVFYSNISYL
jgi:hypothetical protein